MSSYLTVQRFYHLDVAADRIHQEVLRSKQTERDVTALRVEALQPVDHAADRRWLGQGQVVHVLCENGRQVAVTCKKGDNDYIHIFLML